MFVKIIIIINWNKSFAWTDLRLEGVLHMCSFSEELVVSDCLCMYLMYAPSDGEQLSKSLKTDLGIYMVLVSSFTDGEVPHSAAARSLVKTQWQTKRRHDEDDNGTDEDVGSDINPKQGIENTGKALSLT